MKLQVASRLNGIGEYYFSQKLREIEALNKNGAAVINLGIGSPDMAPHQSVIRTLEEQSAKPNVHAYQSYKGIAPLREGISKWYKRWYGVELDPLTEVLPLMGSKEGIMHVCMTYLGEGDEALIPNPGYPAYRSAVQLAGGKCVEYHLTEATNWAPDFEQLERIDLSNVKIMWVNYPHMPTGQAGSLALFEKLIAFGKRNNILICHDNPYSFILSDTLVSLLSVPGAKETAIELNSLSKSHNMAGWRVGMLCGAAERIEEVLRFKSNMDSGMFQPIQLAATQALLLDEAWFVALNKEYSLRREKAYELLNLLDCTYSLAQVGLFVWAKIPDTYETAYALSDAVLAGAKVFITPGGIFGSAGERYLRVSLCSTAENFATAIGRLTNAKERSL